MFANFPEGTSLSAYVKVSFFKRGSTYLDKMFKFE